MTTIMKQSTKWPGVALGLCLIAGCATNNSIHRPNSPSAPANVPPSKPAPPVASSGPALSGSRLKLRPGETATERALDLTDKLGAEEQSKTAVTERVRQLESDLADKDAALRSAIDEVRTTREELARGRANWEQARSEAQSLRDKLQNAEQANLATLESTVGVLQKALDQASEEKPAKSPTASGATKGK